MGVRGSYIVGGKIYCGGEKLFLGKRFQPIVIGRAKIKLGVEASHKIAYGF
ncbi:MAG: hypothetical protein ACOX7U_07070 [Desulfitobacteriia bacterium]